MFQIEERSSSRVPRWVKVPIIDTKTVTLVSTEIKYGSSLTKKNKRTKMIGNEMIIVTTNVCKLLFRSKEKGRIQNTKHQILNYNIPNIPTLKSHRWCHGIQHQAMPRSKILPKICQSHLAEGNIIMRLKNGIISSWHIGFLVPQSLHLDCPAGINALNALFHKHEDIAKSVDKRTEKLSSRSSFIKSLGHGPIGSPARILVNNT